MVKATETELTQIEKDIVVAQNKLQDINDAINRDQGIAEQKSKDIVSLSHFENVLAD